MKQAIVKWNDKTSRYSVDLGDGMLNFINNDSALYFFKDTIGLSLEDITEMNNTLIDNGGCIVQYTPKAS